MPALHRKSEARKSRGERALSGAMSVVLVFFAVFALLLVVLGVLARPDKQGISRVTGHPVLTVLSGSMVPVFSPGDLVVDNPLTAEQAARLAPGNIITFHVPGASGALVTHRIVAVDRAPGGSSGADLRYRTKGDANDSPDRETVAPTQIVGTYRTHLAHAGYVLRAVQTKWVYFFLILLPLLYLIASEFAKRWREPVAASADESDAPGREAVTTSDGAHPMTTAGHTSEPPLVTHISVRGPRG